MTGQNATLTSAAVHGAPPDGMGMVGHLRAFLSWWLEELAGLMPEAVRSRFAGGGARAGMLLENSRLRLTEMRGGQMRPVCEFDLAEMSAEEARDAIARALRRAGLADSPVVLGLPEHSVLRYREELPAIAGRRLASVLGLKLESSAPLPAGSFYWGYRIAGPAVDGRLPVECVLLKKETAEAHCARMAELDVELTGIYPAADLPGEPSLNLMPAGLRQEPVSLWSPLNRGLAVLAAVLTMTMLVLTFYRQETLLEALNSELAALKERTSSVLALRTEALSHTRTLEAVKVAKATAPPLLGILDELSRLLPEDTWASEFRINGAEIQITGNSQSASSLIGLIEKSPSFANARFGSPVVRDPRTEAERFNIRFDWVGGKEVSSPGAAEGGAP